MVYLLRVKKIIVRKIETNHPGWGKKSEKKHHLSISAKYLKTLSLHRDSKGTYDTF